MNRIFKSSATINTHAADSGSVALTHSASASASSATFTSHLGMLIWALIVGSSFPAVQLMTEGLPPLLLTSIRFALAALAIFPLLGKGEQRPSLAGLALYTAMGLCLTMFFGAMFWAAHQTTTLSMATLYVSVPLLAYFLGRRFGVEKREINLLVILILGAAGALILAFSASLERNTGLQFGIPEVAFFLGCLASALYPVLTKWGLNQGWLSPSPAQRTFYSLIIGSLLVGLLGFILEDPRQLYVFTMSDLLLLSYLGVFSSGMTFWLTQNATQRLTPAAVTAYSYLVPLVSMVLLFVDQPHRIGWHWLPGSLLVVIAIWLLLKRDDAKHRVIAAPQ